MPYGMHNTRRRQIKIIYAEDRIPVIAKNKGKNLILNPAKYITTVKPNRIKESPGNLERTKTCSDTNNDIKHNKAA